MTAVWKQLSTYHFYPWGIRRLHLTFPAQKGTDIWLMERWLNRVRKLQPGWWLEPTAEQGRFTGKVMAQIRRLAKYLLVWQPWQVEPLTYSIFGLDVGLGRKAGLFGLRPLLVGDRGEDVRALQNRLVACNRRLALILGRPADGVYDQRTARMVRAFQRDSQMLFPGIRASGQVFSDTMLALWDRTLLGGRVLQLGDRGLDVLALQDLLNGLGYPCQLSGIFDLTVAKTLAGWQRDLGLPQTGLFGYEECWHLGLMRGY